MFAPSQPGVRHNAISFLNTPMYRFVLLGLVGFCLVVFTAAVSLTSTPVHRGYYAIPPGGSYHVTSSGEQIPVGAGPSLEAATSVVTHANLLDHQYRITAEFGQYPNGGAHYGIDVDAWTGTIIHAPVTGIVTEVLRGCVAGNQTCGKGWGNHVWFKSADTGHYILIGHFQSLNDWVQVGVTFDAGAPFGESGATGFASGPHVHIQVNPDQMGNPGSTNPAWEFPWLHCTEPVLGALFGAGCH
ncbi:MAG: M23 family metallopeptidase [Chloroflexia bacterium]